MNGEYYDIEAEDLDFEDFGEDIDYLDSEDIDFEGEGHVDDDYYEEDFEAAERSKLFQYYRNLAKRRARAKAMAKARTGFGGRYTSRRTPSRKPRYFRPPSRGSAKATQVSKGFSRVGTDIRKTKDAVQDVDLDNKLLGQALKAQKGRIYRNETALALSKVTDELQEKFPKEFKENEIIKSVIPLLPLLALKTEKKGSGFESIVSDPRFFGPALVAAIAAVKELSSKDKDDDQTPYEVTILPPMITVRDANKPIKLQAFAYNKNKKEISPQPYSNWTSSDASIATVDNNGLVTAIASGTAYITATVTGTSVRGHAQVNVDIPDQTPREVTILPSMVTMRNSNQTTQLQASAYNKNKEEISPPPSIDWTSSDTAIATVDKDGIVTAIATGTAFITATVTGTSVRGRAQVDVDIDTPQEVNIKYGDITLAAGGGAAGPTLKAIVRGRYGVLSPSPSIDWVSSDTAIATVDKNGVVRAVAAGTASITATVTNTSIEDRIKVTVA